MFTVIVNVEAHRLLLASALAPAFACRPRPATVRRRLSRLRDRGVAWLLSCDAWPPPSLSLRDSLMPSAPPVARLRAMRCQQPPPLLGLAAAA